jgi:DNA-binding transcriptional MocR family regulator
LWAGLPNVNYFPYDTLEAQAARPERWLPSEETSPEAAVDIAKRGMSRLALGPDDSMAAAHIAIPKASTESDPLKRIDLTTALQYGQAQGYPALLSWVQQFVSHMHANVPYKGGPDVILSCGSTDGMNKSLELLVDPWSPETGDVRDRPGILFEPFMYATILSQALPRGLQPVSVGLEGSGLYADDLEEVLANWDFSKGRRPHLMYTVT